MTARQFAMVIAKEINLLGVIELRIIGVQSVGVQSMIVNDLRRHVNNVEEQAEHQPLRNTVRGRGSVRSLAVSWNTVVMVGEYQDDQVKGPMI